MRRKKIAVQRKNFSFSAPSLSDSPEEKADWAEHWAVITKDGNVSFAEIVKTMDLGGSADAEYLEEYSDKDEDDLSDEQIDESNLYEAAAEATFTEISDRIESCGDQQYPFDVTSQSISVRDGSKHSVYIFLLLLSRYGIVPGDNGAKLFEEVCAHVLQNFLGGNLQSCKSFVFGFPRRITCDGLETALGKLCNKLDEGGGCNNNRPTAKDQKDAKLDVVGWKSFNDRRRGKLIIFGQCATGDNWKDKRSELIAPLDWCSKWMRERTYNWPIKAFFIPHRVSLRDWFDSCVDGGLLFDRCRVASLATNLPANLDKQILNWCKSVMNNGKSVKAKK